MQKPPKFILFLAIACIGLAVGFFVYDKYIKVGTHNTELRGFPGRTVDVLMNSYTHGRVVKSGNSYRIYFDRLNPSNNDKLRALGIKEWYVNLELVYNDGFKQYVIHKLSDEVVIDKNSNAVNRGCMSENYSYNILDNEEEAKLLTTVIGEDKDYPKEMVDEWIMTIYKKAFACVVGVGDTVGVPGWMFNAEIVEDEGDTVIVKAYADNELARVDRKSIKLPNR